MTGKSVSQRDIERLSAYLDSELTDKEKRKLEARLSSEPELRDTLANLRRTSEALGQMPQVRAPRNYRLTPEMVGQVRPTRRPGPIRLATALVAAAFVVLVGADALQSTSAGRLSFAGAPAPAMSEMQSAPQESDQARNAPAAGASVAEAQTPGAQDSLKSAQASPEAMLAAQSTEPGAPALGGGAPATASATPSPPPPPTRNAPPPPAAVETAGGQNPGSGPVALRGLEALLGLALIVLLGIQVRRRR